MTIASRKTIEYWTKEDLMEDLGMKEPGGGWRFMEKVHRNQDVLMERIKSIESTLEVAIKRIENQLFWGRDIDKSMGDHLASLKEMRTAVTSLEKRIDRENRFHRWFVGTTITSCGIVLTAWKLFF